MRLQSRAQFLVNFRVSILENFLFHCGAERSIRVDAGHYTRDSLTAGKPPRRSWREVPSSLRILPRGLSLPARRAVARSDGLPSLGQPVRYGSVDGFWSLGFGADPDPSAGRRRDEAAVAASLRGRPYAVRRGRLRGRGAPVLNGLGRSHILRVIPGPRSGARNPDTQVFQNRSGRSMVYS